MRDGGHMRVIATKSKLSSVAFVSTVFLCPSPLPAQSPNNSERLPVAVILVDRLPKVASSSDIALVRGPSRSGGPVRILLPAQTADGESLASAIFLLRAARGVAAFYQDRKY